MINIKKFAIIALVLLIIGAVGSLLTFNGIRQGESISDEKVITDDINQIKVNTENAKIEILPTKEPNIKVELSGTTEKNSKYTFTTDVDDKTLTIKLKDKWFKFIDFSFFEKSLSLNVYVPEKEYELLKVSNNNGRIMAEDVHVQELNVDTNNGRIELNHIISDAITVKADNGKIHLDDVEGKLFGKTSNGEISLITKQLDRPIDFETNNGRIKIETDKEPTNVTFDVRVDNGSINIFGNSDWDTVIGNGDHLIKLRADNGRISVTK